jgi:hypothetical protein
MAFPLITLLFCWGEAVGGGSIGFCEEAIAEFAQCQHCSTMAQLCSQECS